MKGEKYLFTNLILTNERSITFGYKNKALICGWGSINALRILELKDVLYVEGLMANLINIS